MFTKKLGSRLLTQLADLFGFWLYSASRKESIKYYDDSYDKQYPYDGAKVEDEKA